MKFVGKQNRIIFNLLIGGRKHFEARNNSTTKSENEEMFKPNKILTNQVPVTITNSTINYKDFFHLDELNKNLEEQINKERGDAAILVKSFSSINNFSSEQDCMDPNNHQQKAKEIKKILSKRSNFNEISKKQRRIGTKLSHLSRFSSQSQFLANSSRSHTHSESQNQSVKNHLSKDENFQNKNKETSSSTSILPPVMQRKAHTTLDHLDSHLIQQLLEESNNKFVVKDLNDNLEYEQDEIDEIKKKFDININHHHHNVSRTTHSPPAPSLQIDQLHEDNRKKRDENENITISLTEIKHEKTGSTIKIRRFFDRESIRINKLNANKQLELEQKEKPRRKSNSPINKPKRELKSATTTTTNFTLNIYDENEHNMNFDESTTRHVNSTVTNEPNAKNTLLNINVSDTYSDYLKANESEFSYKVKDNESTIQEGDDYYTSYSNRILKEQVEEVKQSLNGTQNFVNDLVRDDYLVNVMNIEPSNLINSVNKHEHANDVTKSREYSNNDEEVEEITTSVKLHLKQEEHTGENENLNIDLMPTNQLASLDLKKLENENEQSDRDLKDRESSPIPSGTREIEKNEKITFESIAPKIPNSKINDEKVHSSLNEVQNDNVENETDQILDSLNSNEDFKKASEDKENGPPFDLKIEIKVKEENIDLASSNVNVETQLENPILIDDSINLENSSIVPKEEIRPQIRANDRVEKAREASLKEKIEINLNILPMSYGKQENEVIEEKKQDFKIQDEEISAIVKPKNTSEDKTKQSKETIEKKSEMKSEKLVKRPVIKGSKESKEPKESTTKAKTKNKVKFDEAKTDKQMKENKKANEQAMASVNTIENEKKEAPLSKEEIVANFNANNRIQKRTKQKPVKDEVAPNETNTITTSGKEKDNEKPNSEKQVYQIEKSKLLQENETHEKEFENEIDKKKDDVKQDDEKPVVSENEIEEATNTVIEEESEYIVEMLKRDEEPKLEEKSVEIKTEIKPENLDKKEEKSTKAIKKTNNKSKKPGLIKSKPLKSTSKNAETVVENPQTNIKEETNTSVAEVEAKIEKYKFQHKQVEIKKKDTCNLSLYLFISHKFGLLKTFHIS